MYVPEKVTSCLIFLIGIQSATKLGLMKCAVQEPQLLSELLQVHAAIHIPPRNHHYSGSSNGDSSDTALLEWQPGIPGEDSRGVSQTIQELCHIHPSSSSFYH